MFKTVLGTTIIKNMPSTPHSHTHTHTHTHTNSEKTADQPEKALCACLWVDGWKYARVLY